MAAILQTHGQFKAEDLLRPPYASKKLEIHEGEPFEKSYAAGGGRAVSLPTRLHQTIAMRAAMHLRDFCSDRPDLDWGAETACLLRRDPDVLFGPDACLYRIRSPLSEGWLEFDPEVVVEVLSPSNTPKEMAYKRRKYFEAGTEQVWTLDPRGRRLDIYFADGRLLSASDGALSGEGIVDGLIVDLDALFAPLKPPAE